MPRSTAPQRPTLRLQYVTCGRPGCRTCQGERLAHGPYWYQLVASGKRFLGARRPAAVSAAMEAAARKRADSERGRKERVRERAQEAAARKRDHRARAPAPPAAPPAHADDLHCLGLAAGATPAEVKRAFRALALRHHPDRPGGSKAAMQRLNDAHERVQRAFAGASEEALP